MASLAGAAWSVEADEEAAVVVVAAALCSAGSGLLASAAACGSCVAVCGASLALVELEAPVASAAACEGAGSSEGAVWCCSSLCCWCWLSLGASVTAGDEAGATSAEAGASLAWASGA